MAKDFSDGEIIICAAVRFKGRVWRGHRHMYALDAMHDELSYTMNRKEMHDEQTDRDQGFITSMNRFVDRALAWKIAENAGQIRLNPLPTIPAPYELYSEDLY